MSLCMTNIWMPQYLADRIKIRSEEDVTNSNDKDASKRSSKRDLILPASSTVPPLSPHSSHGMPKSQNSNNISAAVAPAQD